MAGKKLPYVLAPSFIAPIFDAIKKASVPPNFTTDFLQTKLGFKTSSANAVIPLLKKLGFLTQDGAPTERYKNYRHAIHGPATLGDAIREAYKELFMANEYAYKLSREEVEELVKTMTGAKEESRVVAAVVATFDELCKLAEFEIQPVSAIPKVETEAAKIEERAPVSSVQLPVIHGKKLNLSYTINLNLPATTDIEVFNAIFKSLKEHLLHD